MASNRKVNAYKPREPNSIEAALLYSLGQLGMAQASQILDKTQKTLLNIADQHQPAKRLALCDAERIDRALIEAGCEPANVLAYRARIDAALAGREAPTLARHLEWAIGQLEQAAYAIEKNGLSAEEYRATRSLANRVISHASKIVEQIDEHDTPNVRLVPRP